MSQQSELNAIKLKIRSLANKTVDAGCTEEEARAAMDMVGRLLRRYHLTMAECDVRDVPCRQWEFDTGKSNGHPLSIVIPPLAALFEAKCWTEWTGQTITYKFFGKADDLPMIEYLLRVMWAACNTEVTAFKTSALYSDADNRRGATVSFMHGMADRLSERLGELKREAASEMEQADTRRHKTKGAGVTGTALIALKDQLVKNEFDKLNLRLRTTTTYRTISSAKAQAAGRKAGDRVNLSRPVTRKTTGYLT
jgi:Protein of unknown function (DUF2786)